MPILSTSTNTATHFTPERTPKVPKSHSGNTSGQDPTLWSKYYKQQLPDPEITDKLHANPPPNPTKTMPDRQTTSGQTCLAQRLYSGQGSRRLPL